MEVVVRSLSDAQLMDELKKSHADERRSMVKVLRVLAEVDRRRLFVEQGYSSLYQFCVTALSMSEQEAYLRIAVARIGRRFPQIFERMEAGDLHLSGAAKLAPHLTEENVASLLEAAAKKSKREIEELLAARFPQPDVAVSIRKVPEPARRPMVVDAAAAPVSTSPALIEPPAEPIELSLAPPPARRPDVVQPLAPERYAVRFTASKKCRDLLERAKNLMSHRSANADVGEIVEKALEVLVEQLEKKKFKTTTTPRPRKKTDKKTDSISAEVRRAVYLRDAGRCTYVAPDGRRCDSCSFLELDHITPVANGGPSTVENLRLRCRVHNALAARQVFGDEYMTLMSQGFRPSAKGRPPTADARRISPGTFR